MKPVYTAATVSIIILTCTACSRPQTPTQEAVKPAPMSASTAPAQAPEPIPAQRAPEPPYSLHGDQVGVMTIDDYAAKYEPDSTPEQIHSFPAYFCGESSEQIPTEQECYSGSGFGGVSSAIAGAEVSNMRYYFLGQKLEAISLEFDRDMFQTVRASLTHKYGPSRQSVSTYRNGLGGTFRGLVIDWDNGSSAIELEEIGVTLGKSHLKFWHKGLLAKRTRLQGNVKP